MSIRSTAYIASEISSMSRITGVSLPGIILSAASGAKGSKGVAASPLITARFPPTSMPCAVPGFESGDEGMVYV